MKIYTLIENEKPKTSGFLVEHGLSLYFEYGGKHILFDTGASDAFIYNATLHGIDLHKIDACVISHAHDDHIGGLESFLGINSHAKVYMRSAICGDFYTKHLGKIERTSLDPSIFEKYAARLHFFNDSIDIADGVTASGIRTFRRLPLYASLMLEKKGDSFVSDSLDHELYVAIKENDGTVVLTGCAHHGVLNILMTAAEDFGPIKGVVGGFHLSGSGKRQLLREPESEVAAIAKYLENNKIKKVFTGHCTGKKALDKLTLLSRTQRMYAGDILDI